MAVRMTGHFGEWVQGRLGRVGPVVLVTARCPALDVTVRWHAADPFAVASDPADLLDAPRLEAFLKALNVPAAGRFTVETAMVPGAGSGSSTAVLLAVARAVDGGATGARALARACLRVEGATDPLMLAQPDAVLWSPREARVVEHMDPPPAAEIVGGLFGAPRMTDPEDVDFPDITDLLDPWRQACAEGDLHAAASVASRSAERTTVWRGPANDPMAELAEDTAALGHLRAHTGALRGLIFAPGTVPDGIETRLRAAGIDRPIRFTTAPEPVFAS